MVNGSVDVLLQHLMTLLKATLKLCSICHTHVYITSQAPVIDKADNEEHELCSALRRFVRK